MLHDYIPANDAHFNDWFNNLLLYVQEMHSQWPNIPETEVDALAGAFADWQTFYHPTLSPHTPAVTALKREARTRAERVLRGFVQRFLHWPPVTDGDRVSMNIPLRDHHRTPHIEVTEAVEFFFRISNIRELVIDFRVKGHSTRAKPRGYDGAVFIWAILDAPPDTLDALVHRTMASRTPHRLAFHETERGRTVYVAAAWQNARGHLGAWSSIQNAIIP